MNLLDLYPPSKKNLFGGGSSRPESWTLANAFHLAQVARHQGHVGPPTCHPCSLVAYRPDGPHVSAQACPRCGCTYAAELTVHTQGRGCADRHRAALQVQRLERIRSIRPALPHTRTKRSHARQGLRERSLT